MYCRILLHYSVYYTLYFYPYWYILLCRIKAERDALRHRLHEEKRLAAAAASAVDPEAAASSSSDSAAEDGAEGALTGDMELVPSNIGYAETTTAVQQAGNPAATEGLTEYDIMMAFPSDPPLQQSSAVTAAEPPVQQSSVVTVAEPPLQQSSTAAAAAEPSHKSSHVQNRVDIFAAISSNTLLATEVAKPRKKRRKGEGEESSSEGSSKKRHQKRHKEHKEPQHREQQQQGELQSSIEGRVEQDQPIREPLDDQQRDEAYNKIFKRSSVPPTQDTDSIHNENDANKVLQTAHNVFAYLKHTHLCIAPEATAGLEEEDLGEEVVDEAVVEEVVNEVSEGVVDEVISVDQVLSTMHTSGGSSTKRGAPECGMAEGVSTSKVNYGGAAARSKLNNTIKKFT